MKTVEACKAGLTAEGCRCVAPAYGLRRPSRGEAPLSLARRRSDAGSQSQSGESLRCSPQSKMLRDGRRIHDLSGVAYGTNQFVATGWNPFDVATTILTSLDGTNWVRRESAAQDAGSAIAYANGQFVAVGSQIQTSTDGMRWVQGQLLAPSFLLGIVYGNGQFVAVGSFGIILTSTNAVNWVQRQSGIKTGLRGIGYGNGHFVSVGDIGTILQSGNIINLSITRSTGPLTLSLEGPSGLEYTIQTSNDLVAWREVTKITNAQSAKVILDGLSATAERAFYRAYVP